MKKPKTSPIASALQALALSAAGLALLFSFRPTRAIEPFGPWQLAQLFAVFAFWLGAVVGWGTAATAFLRVAREPGVSAAEEWALRLGLGSLIGALWVSSTAALFGLHRGVSASSAVFLVGGLFLLSFHRRRREATGRSGGGGRRFLQALLAAYVIVRFVHATRLARHGDALYYHLVAPVSWVQRGDISFDAALPLNFMASFWEYLYLYPAQWFLGNDGAGLPAIQLFSQWSHLSLGWLGTGLAVIGLLSRFGLPPVPALLGGFAGLATRSLWWTGALAKNDCGVSLWLILGFLLLWFPGKAGLRSALVAGMLIGAAVAAKYSALFVAGPLIALWVFNPARRPGARRGLAAGAALLGALSTGGALLVRNAAATGNPFFPVPFSWMRTGSVSQSTREYVASLAPTGFDPGVTWRVERLLETRDEGPLAIAFLLSAGLVLRRTVPRRWRPWDGRGVSIFYGLSLASLFCFLAVGRPGTDIRLLGTGLVLLNVTGTLLTLFLLRGLARRWRPFRGVPTGAAVFAALLLTCRMAPEAVIRFPGTFPLERAIEQHTAGDTKLWILKNLPRAEAIVTTGDNEIYYLLGRRIRVGSDDLRLDRLWRQADSEGIVDAGLLLLFRKEGFRYLLDTRYSGEPPPLSARLRPFLEQHPQLIVFRGRESVLVDLRRVEPVP